MDSQDSRLAAFPEPFHKRHRLYLYRDDCTEIVTTFPEESLDGVVCDPPYHLIETTKRFANERAERKMPLAGPYLRHARGFMGKKWDGGDVAFRPETWAAMLRVLKPGAFLIAFGGSRTYHRLACAVDDGGFEIMDSLAWLYSSGFPKSHNVALSIDKKLGHPNRGHEIAVASHERPDGKRLPPGELLPPYEPITDEAKQWDGWGTALRPSMELLVLAQKPRDGTYAHNVLTHGVGALNIRGCRVEAPDGVPVFTKRGDLARHVYGDGLGGSNRTGEIDTDTGRWPPNVLFDQEAADVLDSSVGTLRAGGSISRSVASAPTKNVYGDYQRQGWESYGDSGGPSRFFPRFHYSSKADAKQRSGSSHPTIKPASLIAWLVRLIIPSGGLVLDPFAGTGTTAYAALGQGRSCILIEREESYVADIVRRVFPVGMDL